MNETANTTTIENQGSPLVTQPLPSDHGSLVPGQLYLANESRFNSAFFSTPLTGYATGWRDPGKLDELLDFIAPPVQVARRFEFKAADHAEFFLSETDDSRAIGADFKRVEYKGSTQLGKTFNKGLTIRLDLDLVGQMSNWREVYTGRLLQRLLRNELRRIVDAISGAAAGTAKTWDSTAGKDPDQDILTELLSGSDESGLRCNRILFGDVAWNKRVLAHRAQATAGGYASAALTPDELAGILGVDGVRVSRDRWQSSASAKSRIVGDIVLTFFAMDNPGLEDASHAKRFWSPTEGGGIYRVYEQQVNSKLVDLTVEHYSTVMLLTTLGLRKLTIS